MDARIRLLLEVFDQAFGGHSWHGTTLSGSLRGVTAGRALWRPGPGRGGANILGVNRPAAVREGQPRGPPNPRPALNVTRTQKHLTAASTPPTGGADAPGGAPP